MSDDQAMKGESEVRIDRLADMIEAERELRSASTHFEHAQTEVVRAAEHLLEWAHRWQDCRERALQAYPTELRPEHVTFYGTGNRMWEARETMDQFCARVREQQASIAALTPAPDAPVSGDGEIEIPEGFLRSHNGTCEVPSGTEVEYVYEDGVRGYGVAQNGWIGHPVRTKELPVDLPIIAYRRIESQIEIPSGFTKWEGGFYDDWVHDNLDVNRTETEVEVLFRDGSHMTGLPGGFLWNHANDSVDIIAYRILSEPAGEGETERPLHERFPAGKAGRDYESGLVDGATYLGERKEDRSPAYLDGLSAGREVRDGFAPPPLSEEDPLAAALIGLEAEGYQHVVDAEPAPEPIVGGEDITLRTDWTPLSSIAPNVPGPISGFEIETRFSDVHGEWVYRHVPVEELGEQSEPFEMAKVEAEEPLNLDQMDDLGITNSDASAMLRMMTARKLEGVS